MADSDISGLSTVSTLTGAEQLLVTQGGLDKYLTLSTLKTFRDTFENDYPDSNGWTRPADWLPMPTPSDGYFDVLVPVFPDGPNRLTLRMNTTLSGTMNIDWGDGTVQTALTHGTDYGHTYTYANLTGTDCRRGYRQAIARMYPTNVAQGVSSVAIRANGGSYDHGEAPKLVLEAQCQLPGAADFSSFCQYCGMMERFTFYDEDATNMSNAFYYCFTLQSLRNLGSTPFASVTNMSSCFVLCASLKELTFPSGSLALVTNISSMFQDCIALKKLDLPTNAFAAVTDMSTWGGCGGMPRMVFPSGSLAAVTNMDQAFRFNPAIREIIFATGGFASLASVSNTFLNSGNISKISNFTCPITFDLTSNYLSSAALDEIYTALPTVTTKTVTVSTNYGTTGDTPSIATGKGWTVTGS